MVEVFVMVDAWAVVEVTVTVETGMVVEVTVIAADEPTVYPR